MKKAIFSSLLILCGVACGSYATAAGAPFELKSKAMPDGRPIQSTQVFDGFGCSGKNISPDLQWSNPPKGTRSFAVTMYDPDAPTGSGWWHWLVVNIPADVTELKAGASKDGLPKGALQTRTDFGTVGYGGPCPPPQSKPHRYFVRLFALKVDKIDVDANASGAMVGYQLNQNKLAEISLVGTYQR